ncbi:GFA family protein [Sulfitobacter sp. S190]|uniref:GFA family protein n=1 Tax=Sulfitobacter sp. S190 TaxID=2867022 RepID=UPI0021A89B92|nr:GFA family protein [Sulfitobacter sp. S190]UWR22942.1 GFA family protein [Sulfitobacter sp. S190]
MDFPKRICEIFGMENSGPITGGRQCGAVRYSVASLGRSSVCHCRMCQRAFGSFYAALVVAQDLIWTSGQPSFFASSNLSKRGFCQGCGTPLSLKNSDDALLEIATGSLDNPELAPPSLQINHRYACSFSDDIGKLPTPDSETVAENDEWNATVISYQKP